MIALNQVKPLLYTHMLLVANHDNRHLQFACFEIASDVWDDYYESLMEFGRRNRPFESYPHDTKFCSMLMMEATRLPDPLDMESWMTLGMEFASTLFRETGLSIDAFCDLVADPVMLPELPEKLRPFLELVVLEDADERQVH